MGIIMDNLIFSLNATIPLFLVMVVGYVLRQVKLIDEPFVKSLNSFNYTVTLPVLLFQDMSTADFYSEWDFHYVAFCFLATLVSYFLILLVTLLFVKDKTIRGEFLQASYRGSAAVLGMAFIANIYDTTSAATPLMILGTVPLYNILAVITLSMLGPGSEGLSGKSVKKTLIGILKNPILWGIFLGMIPALLRIQYPVMIDKTLSLISRIASPLALIGLGAGFEGKKAIAKIKPTVVCSMIRLLILPLTFLPVAAFLGFTGEKMISLLIMLGAPTTSSCYIMAKNMGHEGVLTSSVVVATTFFSSVTLTLWLYLLKNFGLV